MTSIFALELVKACVICGNNHDYENCNLIKITKHIIDTEIPSRAKLSIPNSLQLQLLQDGSYSVVTKSIIYKGTKFGPFVAKKVDSIDPTTKFPLKVDLLDENGNSEYYLDCKDENECNWLIFITPAKSYKEQNLFCYQERGQIYYVTIKTIAFGETLKVWYSPFYAEKMKTQVLTENSKLKIAKYIDVDVLIKEQQKIIDRKLWTCRFCGQVETKVVLFAKHVQNHYTNQFKRICDICKSGFQSKAGLAKHLKINHSTTINIKCPIRPKSIDQSEIFHKDVALGGPLLNDMNDLFNDSTDLQQASLNQFDLSLDHSNLLLDSDNLIDENLLGANVKDLDHFNFEIDDNQKQFVCDICLKQFSKLKLLVVHLRHHTGEYTCTQCLKVFCRNENLKSHFCNNTRKFACKYCDKLFAQPKYVRRHIVVFHNRQHTCSFCNRFFYSKKEFQLHDCQNQLGLVNQPYTCTTCGKNFTQHAYLRKHLKTHEPKTHDPKTKPGRKVKSFVCETCGVTLQDMNSYFLHRKTHSEPKFHCGTCKKQFRRVDTLNAHLLTHQADLEIECETCHKNLKSTRSYKRHQKLHNENTINCSNCSATFRNNSSLKRHIKTKHHAKNKQLFDEMYYCTICDKGVKLKSSLLRHMKKIHKLDNVDINLIKPTPVSLSNKNILGAINTNSSQRSDEKCDTLTDLAQTDLDDLLILNNTKISNLNRAEEVKELLTEQAKEVCLSIPDLTEGDQEITLGKNAYILDNGTIVQPENDSDNVIIYVLN